MATAGTVKAAGPAASGGDVTAVIFDCDGTTAGIAAGMTVIGFLGGRHIRDGHADRLRAAGARLICPHMDDLAGLVAGLGADPGRRSIRPRPSRARSGSRSGCAACRTG